LSRNEKSSIFIYTITIKMKAIQNIHQLNRTAQRGLSIWSDSLCQDVVIGFTYNNEPKQDTDLG
jgi:hypothetical protein